VALEKGLKGLKRDSVNLLMCPSFQEFFLDFVLIAIKTELMFEGWCTFQQLGPARQQWAQS
jgi:hypothetical protein